MAIFANSRKADGRHFENSFISISQPRIIRFRSNLVCRCKFPFQGWLFDKKKSKFFKLKMADGRHIENRFFAISRRLIGQSMRNSKRRWRFTCQYRSIDQNCNFPKLKMAEGRNFENSFRSSFLQWSNVIHCISMGALVSMKSWNRKYYIEKLHAVYLHLYKPMI